MATEVKFCGLTRAADAAMAARAGASFVGVILASGPRLLTVDAARQVLEAAEPARLAPRVRRVGVFAAAPPQEIGRSASGLELDVVQLHEDPDADDVDAVRDYFSGEVWGVLRIAGTGLPDHAEALAAASDAIVVDARAPGALGGTGRTLDWRGLAGELANLRASARLVLAGGLTPENVAAAIAALRPDVVDVSSGVEMSPGIKDHERMHAFAAAAGVPPGKTGDR